MQLLSVFSKLPNNTLAGLKKSLHEKLGRNRYEILQTFAEIKRISF